jgi:flavin reductase (DIM6/NTAB) family NADH-FMN oxidoreductase RutF
VDSAFGGKNVDEAAKKSVLRMMPYGLYAVTASDGKTTNAFTANWLSQVSFEPPMVVIAIEHDARSLEMIQRSGRYGVCVLASGQRELAGHLGRSSKRNPEKLSSVSYRLEEGLPVLDEALGYVLCRLVSSHRAGDHMLVVGEVFEAGVQREADPLTLKETGFRYAG